MAVELFKDGKSKLFHPKRFRRAIEHGGWSLTPEDDKPAGCSFIEEAAPVSEAAFGSLGTSSPAQKEKPKAKPKPNKKA